MSKVIPFSGTTRNDISPEKVLDGAKDQKFKNILIIGLCDDNDHYCAASTAKKGDLLWLIEVFKAKLISGQFDE